MNTKLTLNKETLAELTADDMSAVVGGAGGSDTCTCTLGVCVTGDPLVVAFNTCLACVP